MVPIPSSHLEPLAKEPAFVQARLTLERCMREFQQRHCCTALNQPSAPTNIPVQQTATAMNQCFCVCNGPCQCRCLERNPSIVAAEWLPSHLVVQLIRQMFQACLQPPWDIRCFANPDQSSLLSQLFLQQMQSQMNQQGNELVQAVPGPGQINLTPNYFQLTLDVSGVRPDELSVAVMGRCVLVGAERKGRVTGVAHQEALLRRYELPMTADSDQAHCNLTPDGVLSIAAPWRDS